MSSMYGYVSCTATGPKHDEQDSAIRAFGVQDGFIIEERPSKKNSRPCFRSLLKTLKAGDVLVVASLDGLGSNFSEIFGHWETLSKKLRKH